MIFYHSTMTFYKYLHFNKNWFLKKIFLWKTTVIENCSQSVYALYYENTIKLKFTYLLHIKPHFNRLKT